MSTLLTSTLLKNLQKNAGKSADTDYHAVPDDFVSISWTKDCLSILWTGCTHDTASINVEFIEPVN